MSDVVIRVATEKDLDGIAGMALHFVEQTRYRATVPADRTHLKLAAIRLLEVGAIFVAETPSGLVGMLAAVVYPHLLTGAWTLSEQAWWVEPDARSHGVAERLLEAYETWGRSQGARRSELAARKRALERYYLRFGYVPAERVFVKDL